VHGVVLLTGYTFSTWILSCWNNVEECAKLRSITFHKICVFRRALPKFSLQFGPRSGGLIQVTLRMNDTVRDVVPLTVGIHTFVYSYLVDSQMF